MCCERLLALFRQSGKTQKHGRAISIERLLSCALLKQVHKIHKAASGSDPCRNLTRADLHQRHCAINSRSSQIKAKPRGDQSFLRFQGYMVNMRKKHVGVLCAEDAQTEKRDISAQWAAMSERQKSQWKTRDSMPTEQTQDDSEDICKDLETLRYDQHVGHQLWHTSSIRQPFTFQAVDETASSLMRNRFQES